MVMAKQVWRLLRCFYKTISIKCLLFFFVLDVSQTNIYKEPTQSRVAYLLIVGRSTGILQQSYQ